MGDESLQEEALASPALRLCSDCTQHSGSGSPRCLLVQGGGCLCLVSRRLPLPRASLGRWALHRDHLSVGPFSVSRPPGFTSFGSHLSGRKPNRWIQAAQSPGLSVSPSWGFRCGERPELPPHCWRRGWGMSALHQLSDAWRAPAQGGTRGSAEQTLARGWSLHLPTSDTWQLTSCIASPQWCSNFTHLASVHPPVLLLHSSSFDALQDESWQHSLREKTKV